MASTRRDRVLEDVIETLATIKGQAPYETNFQTVEDGLRDAEHLGPGEFDYVGVSSDPDVRTDHKMEGFRETRNETFIVIAAHLRVPDVIVDDAEVRRWRRKLASDALADIIHALDVDNTRGDNASGTYIQSSISNEAIGAVSDVGAYVSIVILYKIVYHEGTERPEVEMSYGELRQGASQVTPVAGAWSAFALDTLGFTKYFDMPVAGRLRYIGPKTRRFAVTGTWAAQCNASGLGLRFTILKNGAEEPAGFQVIETVGVGESGTLGFTRVVELALNDYLELAHRTTSGSALVDNLSVVLSAHELVH